MSAVVKKESRAMTALRARLEQLLGEAVDRADRAKVRAEKAEALYSEERRRLRSLAARLTDPRQIVEWTDVPDHVASAIDYAGRTGCALMLSARVVQEWDTGLPMPQERRVIEVVSYRREDA